MSKFTEWAKHEYIEQRRLLILPGLALIFILAIPLFIIFVCPAIDKFLRLPHFYYGLQNVITGLVLVIAGFIFAMWSILAQFTIGRGTPIPMMPTQKLVISRPFNYCRNPMTLGTILLYLGISIWVGSITAVVIMVLLDILLVIYIKRVEEKELQERYGAEYLEYKRRTPFLFPRIRKRSK
jgi:protein-S-isoprenylcysteine O-methyltransferase Ste14